ncbi:helix-turn-helix domain-containing protein [Rhizobium sp.]
MTHPFVSSPFEPDPFEGLTIDIPDAIRERLRRRWQAPRPPAVPGELQFTPRLGEPRLVRKVALPGRRRSLGLRSVCGTVRMVTGEILSLTGPRPVAERDRRFAVAHVQQIAMYVCHVALQLTMTDVAQGFGRDRTTVGYACAKVEDRRDDRAFDDLVGAVERVVDAVFAGRHADG